MVMESFVSVSEKLNPVFESFLLLMQFHLCFEPVLW